MECSDGLLLAFDILSRTTDTIDEARTGFNIARLFDVLGWCSPAIIVMKSFLQRLCENSLEWDEPVPTQIEHNWKKWKRELPVLRDHQIMRPYFPREIEVVSKELQGFCDASEAAYSGVINLRAIDTKGNVHVSLVMAKTKVAPLKRAFDSMIGVMQRSIALQAT